REGTGMKLSKNLKKEILTCAVGVFAAIVTSVSVRLIHDAITTDACITITDSENEFPVITAKEPGVIGGFDFRFPGDWLTQFNVEVTVKDTNWDGEVRVYLIGTETQEQFFLGTLDRDKKTTVLRVEGTCPTIAKVVEVRETESGKVIITERGGDLGKVTNMLEENEGRVCLKFVMSGNGSVVIEKVRIFIDWSYMDDVWINMRSIIGDIIR
ncbi:hypothetical protein M1O20_06960, partial [Dehalococcoidia bacterium]|nr:hypothetical protein [Dehalococcoidia bacterium]